MILFVYRGGFAVIEVYSSISIISGFSALLFPFIILFLCNKINYTIYTVLTVASFVSCTTSICTQLFSTSYLVRLKDWSALMDTSQGIAIISLWLLCVTSVFNIAVSLIYFKKNKNTGKTHIIF